MTRDAMRSLPRLKGALRSGVALVDQSPWQTAQALTPLAVSAEEIRYAHAAERLADHAVDQAFAAALREASLSAQNRTLAGGALALSRKVTQLQQSVAQDRALVKQLTAAQGPASSNNAAAKPGQTGSTQNDLQSTLQNNLQNNGNDLDVAKAQLGLDSDELDDAKADLDRASGDVRPQIQDELSARQAAMKKYDAEDHGSGDTAVQNAAKYGTLAGRIGAWFHQSSRLAQIQQAASDTRASIPAMTAAHDALEAKIGASTQADAQNNVDRATHLAHLQTESVQRQLMSIYDDRARTAEQLANVYDKWATQVQLQHRILLHLMLQSAAWILVISIGMVLCAGLVQRLMELPRMDLRQRRTLRSILELLIQIVGAVCILLVIFGAPQQTTEMLGLATAAITIALQDFVLAFFGWFVLMSKKGIRVGDTVEIEGVGGEVIEIGLMSTTLLETGTLAGKGYPTGRRISFMNSFAIRGKYFNFSTAGQWMWDQVTVSIPASVDARAAAERIQNAVQEETHENASEASREWMRSARDATLSRRGARPSVNLQPASGGFDAEVRYVTRASQREETRNLLYERVTEVLREIAAPAA